MSIKLHSHVFAGNPINKFSQNGVASPSSVFKTLKDRILNNTLDLGVKFEVLAFRKGRPLAGSVGDDLKTQNWHLGWLNLSDFRGVLDDSWGNFSENEFVYLGSKPENDVVYWAVDVSEDEGLVNKFGSRQLCFTELRTLMVATDWANQMAMADLAVAGHVCRFPSFIFVNILCRTMYVCRKVLILVLGRFVTCQSCIVLKFDKNE